MAGRDERVRGGRAVLAERPTKGTLQKLGVKWQSRLSKGALTKRSDPHAEVGAAAVAHVALRRDRLLDLLAGEAVSQDRTAPYPALQKTIDTKLDLVRLSAYLLISKQLLASYKQ